MFNFFRHKKDLNSRNLIFNLLKRDEIIKEIEDKNNILIDVRTKREYETMRIQNAVNIEVSNLKLYENEYRNKNKIIVYCSSGIRTKEAIKELNSIGYYNVYIWDYGSLANFPFKQYIKK